MGKKDRPWGIEAGVGFTNLQYNDIGTHTVSSRLVDFNSVCAYTSRRRGHLWLHVAAGASFFVAMKGETPGELTTNKDVVALVPKAEAAIGANPLMLKVGVHLLSKTAVAPLLWSVGVNVYLGYFGR